MLPTKPGTEPRELLPAIQLAAELNEVEICGGRFAYPNGLSIWEWVALKAVKSAQRTDSNAEREPKAGPPAPPPIMTRQRGQMAGQGFNFARMTAIPTEDIPKS